MTNLPALPEDTTLARIQRAATAEERAELQTAVMERVNDPRFARPTPRFLTELPFGGDDDEITDRIAAGVLVAADPDALQDSSGTVPTKELVGKPLCVYDIRVMDGALEGSWQAYLLFDFTLEADPEHHLGNTSSKQVIARLARAWVDGQLPLKGAITEIDTTGARGNKALAFIAEFAPEQAF